MSWNSVALGDICSIVNGGTPKSEVSEYWNGDLNWITPKEMGKLNSREIATTERKITEKGMKNSSARLLPVNSVILSSRAPIGHLAINKELMATNQGCKGLVPSASLNFEYLYHFLSYSKETLNDMGTGATFKELSGSKLKTLQIPFPPLATQKKIVAKLDAIFAEIDKSTAAAEANAGNAEALFQSYLTDVFERGGDGWTDRKLSDISSFMGRGKSKHRPRNDESLYGGIYPFIQTGDVRNSKKYIKNFSQTYNDKGLSQSKLWKANTVCITIAANIAEVGILGFDACFPDSVIGVVVDKEKISEDFLYLMLLFAQQLIKSKSKGSAQENINLGTFEDMLFKVPPKKEQDTIVHQLNHLRDLADSIAESQLGKVTSLSNLKQSILKQAFNGELVKE